MKESENRIFRFSVEQNAMERIFRGPLKGATGALSRERIPG
jgi:hypothetical protein